MLKSHKTIIVFLLRALGIFLVWVFVYNFWLSGTDAIDSFLINLLIGMGSIILKLMGYAVFAGSDSIGITGTSGVVISPSCDGLSLFVLFAGFIIAFPGNARAKSLFIPAGILLIHLLNTLRIVALVLLVRYSPQLLAFNHSYTFTLLMYLCIFMMWLVWINRCSGTKNILK
jgi:exosortase family protein XrtF